MECLVFVRFFPGGRLAPEEFFARISARWYSIEGDYNDNPEKRSSERITDAQPSKSAICIADYDSVEQLAVDLSIMPGAGISNVEVLSVSEEMELPREGFIGPAASTTTLAR